MDVQAVTPNIAFEEGISNFSFSLYSALERTGNEFISPYSLSAALLLLSLGTDGTTEDQLLTAMFGDLDLGDVHFNYKKLNSKLFARTETGITLSLANRIFASTRITLLDSFISEAFDNYGSEVERLDFVTQTETSRLNINNWIANQTNNKIQDMIPKGILDRNTIMVLANAIYFKGTWKNEFDPKNTQKRNFFVRSNIQKQVDMMYNELNAKAGENTELNCKILQLPYVGDKLSMVFILPNDGNGLSQLENQLTFNTFDNLLSNLQQQKTIIRIPKFSVEAEYDLEPVLNILGISEIFDSRAANFSNMVPLDSTNVDVYVSDARHKAFVEVNEQGSEAAAATTLTIGLTSALITQKPPFEFVADHPFLFVIMDNLSKTILFIGRFAEP